MSFTEDKPANESQKLELPKKLRPDENAWCLIIAFIQVGGGIFGIGIFAYHYGTMPNSLLLTLVVAPFFYGIYAGSLLWQGKVKGINHSLIVQAIQIPSIMFDLLGFRSQLGIGLITGWFDSKVTLLQLDIWSYSILHINPQTGFSSAGINLIALAALYFLWSFKIKIELYQQRNVNTQSEN